MAADGDVSDGDWPTADPRRIQTAAVAWPPPHQTHLYSSPTHRTPTAPDRPAAATTSVSEPSASADLIHLSRANRQELHHCSWFCHHRSHRGGGRAAVAVADHERGPAFSAGRTESSSATPTDLTRPALRPGLAQSRVRTTWHGRLLRCHSRLPPVEVGATEARRLVKAAFAVISSNRSATTTATTPTVVAAR